MSDRLGGRDASEHYERAKRLARAGGYKFQRARLRGCVSYIYTFVRASVCTSVGACMHTHTHPLKMQYIRILSISVIRSVHGPCQRFLLDHSPMPTGGGAPAHPARPRACARPLPFSGLIRGDRHRVRLAVPVRELADARHGRPGLVAARARRRARREVPRRHGHVP